MGGLTSRAIARKSFASEASSRPKYYSAPSRTSAEGPYSGGGAKRTFEPPIRSGSLRARRRARGVLARGGHARLARRRDRGRGAAERRSEASGVARAVPGRGAGRSERSGIGFGAVRAREGPRRRAGEAGGCAREGVLTSSGPRRDRCGLRSPSTAGDGLEPWDSFLRSTAFGAILAVVRATEWRWAPYRIDRSPGCSRQECTAVPLHHARRSVGQIRLGCFTNLTTGEFREREQEVR